LCDARGWGLGRRCGVEARGVLAEEAVLLRHV